MLAATLAYAVGAAAAEPHGAALPGAVGWNGTLHGGLPMPNYAPAYLASGLFGVRVPPGALARPGSCANCSRELWNFFAPTVSTMVGGYVYVEDTRQAPSAHPDGQHDRQIGASPAPYPFETEVLVTTPGGVVASLQASIQGPDMNGDPSEVTPLSQSLDMATGELTTELRFGAKDGSWWVALTALQFISQSVPSLALQTLTITSRHPTTLPVVMRPRITPTGLPGTPYTSTTPSDIFNEGTPNMLLAMRSNSGAEVAMCAATQCSSGAHNIPMREAAKISLPSELRSSKMAAVSLLAGPGGVMPPLVAEPCNSTSGESTMTSYIGVVSDASHPVPAAGALRSAHFGVYRGYGHLRTENRKVWAQRWRNRIVPRGPSQCPHMLIT